MHLLIKLFDYFKSVTVNTDGSLDSLVPALPVHVHMELSQKACNYVAVILDLQNL